MRKRAGSKGTEKESAGSEMGCGGFEHRTGLVERMVGVRQFVKIVGEDVRPEVV